MSGKIGNSNYIQKTLKDNELFAKKKFGQNFLTDQNILSSIVKSSNIDKDTLVIEVGPGLGSLTEHLCLNAGFVLAYEIDSELIPILKKNLSEFNNFEVINKDILEVNINEDIDLYKKDFKNVALVANLPYYITTPIILGLLEKTDKIKSYTMMMQLEVANRICGNTKTKDYNALSIAIQYRAKATKCFNVPRTVFIPSPNVDSAVIHLELYKELPYKAINEQLFFSFVRLAFSQRRKTLINNISQKYDKELSLKMLNHFNIKENVRSEELSVKDFVMLSDYIGENYEG